MIQFFMPMQPPTATAQEHKINTRGKRPRFYNTPEIDDAKAKFRAGAAPYRPASKLVGAVRFTTKWCWACGTKHKNGEYKITKPDTDNMLKLLKDEMTKLGFWQDDAQVASEITEKFWADTPGIFVKIEALDL